MLRNMPISKYREITVSRKFNVIYNVGLSVFFSPKKENSSFSVSLCLSLAAPNQRVDKKTVLDVASTRKKKKRNRHRGFVAGSSCFVQDAPSAYEIERNRSNQ